MLLSSAIPVFPEGAGIEWDILNQETIKLNAEGKYDRAVIVAQKALAVAMENVGPDHPAVATSLENIAVLYRETGRKDAAVPLEQRAAAIRAIKR